MRQEALIDSQNKEYADWVRGIQDHFEMCWIFAIGLLHSILVISMMIIEQHNVRVNQASITVHSNRPLNSPVPDISTATLL